MEKDLMSNSKFPISHVLIDCENVGLNGLTNLVVNTDGSPLKFILFHNSTNKINLSLTQLKAFGYALSEGRIELVELTIPTNMTKKQAENALDFYIAFYMGTIMPFEPFNSHCVIISKDHDYDPLILHVQNQFGKDRCERVDSYEALTKKLGLNENTQEEKNVSVIKESNAQSAKATKKSSVQKNFDLQKSLEKAKSTLKKMSKNKPSTKTKLQRSLKSWLSADKPSDANLQSLIEALQKENVIEISEDGNKIMYK